MLRWRANATWQAAALISKAIRSSGRSSCLWQDGWSDTNITDPTIIEDAAERVGVPIAALTIEEIP